MFARDPRPALEPQVLVVDDEPANRKLLQVLLTSEGCRVTLASSSLEALELLRSQPPDLILLDVMMPVMDGYQLAGRIKADPGTAHIPIIMVTALDSRKARILGLSAGADDFVSKPLDRTELLLRVKSLLRLKAYGDHYDNYSQDLEKEVASRTAQLLQLNNELEARVDARTAELNLAREAAEHANKAKSVFLATMSHEIRTPMNGVIGMVDVLQQSSLKGYQVEMVALIRDSAVSLLRIIDDILDFSKIEAGKLDVEKQPMRLADVIEKGCSILDQSAVDRNVRMTVFVDPQIPSLVSGDAMRLRQVLVNLVGNAIKFSSGRGKTGAVAVRAILAGRDGGSATVDLSVSDNGIGIDPVTLPRLFTPFVQADESTTRLFGGTGLGLAISDMLVRLMGGAISVRSAPGRGSIFSVRLRFDEVAGAARPPEMAALALHGLQCLIIGSENPMADDLGAYLRHAGVVVAFSPDLAGASAAELPPGPWLWLILPSQAVPPLADLRAMAAGGQASGTRFVALDWGGQRRPHVEAVDFVSMDAGRLSRTSLLGLVALAAGRMQAKRSEDEERMTDDWCMPALQPALRRQVRPILVAEDNEINRQVVVRQLRLMGFRSEVAVNGFEALACWRRGDYSLLLTDVQMPEMDGYELAAAIRAEETGGGRLPIIALTANAMRNEEVRCRAAGIDAWLSKPVQLAELNATIERWIGCAAQPPTVLDPPAATFSTTAPPVLPVDLEVLAGLICDDDVAIDEVLQAYEESAAQAQKTIARALAEGTLQVAGDTAHNLKSASRAIGAMRLGEICAVMEDMARTASAADLRTCHAEFEAEMAAVGDFLASRARARRSVESARSAVRSPGTIDA